MTHTNETIDEFESLEARDARVGRIVEMDLGEVERQLGARMKFESALQALWAKRDAETAKYFAAYAAACSLAIFVEHIEAGYPPKKGGALVEDAKRKLRELASFDDSDFFTRFDKVEG